jgi:hypothetical protein
MKVLGNQPPPRPRQNHDGTLEGFSRGEAIAQTVGFVIQLLLGAAVAWLLWRDRPAGRDRANRARRY